MRKLPYIGLHVKRQDVTDPNEVEGRGDGGEQATESAQAPRVFSRSAHDRVRPENFFAFGLTGCVALVAFRSGIDSTAGLFSF